VKAGLKELDLHHLLLPFVSLGLTQRRRKRRRRRASVPKNRQAWWGAQALSSWRAMTMRWIWLVPS
jgi:hypothetical protein